MSNTLVPASVVESVNPKTTERSHEMTTDLELLNFRIPSKTKQKFLETCRRRNQAMTSVLNHFIADFINENNRCEEDEVTLPLDFFAENESVL